MRERLRRQPSPLLQGEAAAFQRGQQVVVLARGGDIATDGWFLAAARTMAGPPMSICSTHSSGVAPEVTVSVKG